MYQLNETERWREHRRELLRENEGERLAARKKNGTGRSDARLRVVRVPGGFAFVEDESATERS